jgi:hypothetical protein
MRTTLALEAAVMDISVPIRVMVHHVPEKKTICVLHQVDKNYWKFPMREEMSNRVSAHERIY